MPESRGRNRKSTPYTPPQKSKAPEPNPRWWAPTFVTLLVVGLLWIVVYYISQYKFPIEALGAWNLGVGFALLISGFAMTMRWR